MNISRLYRTIRDLQPRQVWYRLWYPVKNKCFRPGPVPNQAVTAAADFPQIVFTSLPPHGSFSPQDNIFDFLNISHRFGPHIDWNFDGHGRLWTYNLNYFDWLQDGSVPVADRLQTIYQYIMADPATGREPYPISLRGMNWIMFLAAQNIHDEKIDRFLYRSYQRLAAFPEYHIAANHLLENAFSLFFAAHYFDHKQWYALAEKLLVRELNEQVLADGGHYERSPMYHSILLGRLLACIALAQKSGRFPNEQLQASMAGKAGLMTAWLKAFSFTDGSYAMTGDSAPGIAPPPGVLIDMAKSLAINIPVTALNQSGYRNIKGQDWELLVSLSGPTPAYQPGHAHADALSFCLQAHGQPLIVDTGVSTYEKGAQRLWERSTDAHNTIGIENLSSSDIWHGFRVGKKAHVFIDAVPGQSITAYHDGYRHMGVIHERSYRWTNQKIIIEDKIKTQKGRQALLHLHFHPDVLLTQTGKNRFTANGIRLSIENESDAQLQEYQFCAGFNKRTKAQRLRLSAAERIAIVIEF